MTRSKILPRLGARTAKPSVRSREGLPMTPDTDRAQFALAVLQSVQQSQEY